MTKATTIHLGFEVGSGKPVEIPFKHMAICGQTQEAGKTTALEALIARSGVRAVTFVTKRGEGAFTTARRIDPYFREQADWQFVASILEASRGEKLKFERAWIIRASKGARTLADVQRNVRKAMETAKGMSADVYLTLDAYLEAVVPQIAAVRWAPALRLEAGVNAMDLTGLNVEMQHLVIKSTLDWVLAKEESTVVVVPEAWKFIPQGRGTPVKLAAEAFVRQGAGLGNYLWLDSQDIGGIEKTILRSVPLWILGVQREANEIARTLSNIPAGIAKPKAADVALLELGQFYACWSRHVLRTYVQPAWLDHETAFQVAIGQKSTESLVHLVDRVRARHQEEIVNATEARRLETENEQLRKENAELNRRITAFEQRLSARPEHAGVAETDRGRAPRDERTPPVRPAPAARTSTADLNGNEALYQAFKARLIDEAPAVLKLCLSRPEIEVTVTRKMLTIDEYSGKGRIARLLKEGFFSEPKSPSQVRAALKRTGPDMNTANIGRALDDFTRDGFVTDEGSGYREVPGMTVNVLET